MLSKTLHDLRFPFSVGGTVTDVPKRVRLGSNVRGRNEKCLERESVRDNKRSGTSKVGETVKEQ